MNEKKYKRQCPICNGDVYHSNQKTLNNALKTNNPCRSCSQKISNKKPKIFKRNCPECGNEISYMKENTMKNAELKKKICISCKTKGENNPMYGVHRFGKENPMYGKTVYDVWVQKYGEEIADQKLLETKKKLSIASSGENNPNYQNKSNGAKAWSKYGKECKGKTLEEIYGKDKANEIKQKISNAASGENNPMYGKPAPEGSGNGWSGHYKNIYFRSILELHYLIYLIDNNIKFENGEKRKHVIQYEMDGINRNYFPDYYLIETQEYIEIKPKALVSSYQNKLKFEAAKEKLGNKHIILTEDNIVKIELEILYNKYINKELIFDKRYIEKFENYYKENRKKE
jgi:endogenous inhibitor of DNA gyrase (YacG/DUF329 family)